MAETSETLQAAQALWAQERRRTRETVQDELARVENVVAIDLEVPFGDPTLANDLAAGEQRDVTIPFDYTIARWRLLPQSTGSLTVTVSRATYAAYPTFTAIGTATISSAAKGEDATLAGWTTAGSADDVLRLVASGPSSGLKYATCVLRLRRVVRPTLGAYTASPD